MNNLSAEHKLRVAQILDLAYTISESMSDSEISRLRKHVRKIKAMDIGKKRVRTIEIPEPQFIPAWGPTIPNKEPVTVPATPEKVPVTVGGKRG